jgi:hypothetical protein
MSFSTFSLKALPELTIAHPHMKLLRSNNGVVLDFRQGLSRRKVQ